MKPVKPDAKGHLADGCKGFSEEGSRQKVGYRCNGGVVLDNIESGCSFCVVSCSYTRHRENAWEITRGTDGHVEGSGAAPKPLTGQAAAIKHVVAFPGCAYVIDHLLTNVASSLGVTTFADNATTTCLADGGLRTQHRRYRRSSSIPSGS